MANIQTGMAQSVRSAAVSAFAELGYNGTSVREIARRAGTSVAALYHYYPSKELVLAGLVDTYLEDLLTTVRRAQAEAGDDAAKQLEAVVRSHVGFHLDNAAAGLVCNAELHRLPPEIRSGPIQKRRDEVALFASTVALGVDQGSFVVRNVDAAARAVFELCTAVLTLYDDDTVTYEQHLGETYAVLALNVVGYRPLVTGASR